MCRKGFSLNMVFSPLLCLFLLFHLRGTSASASTVWSALCGSDHLTYLKSCQERGILFAINGNSVDKARFCESIQFHKAEGCIFEDSFSGDLCMLHNFLGRRVLQERSGEGSKKRRVEFVSSYPVKASMAASGFLLFCCAIVCPCFHKERKAKTPEVLPKEPNSVKKVTSFEMSPLSEKIPPRPYRFPQSPSRFAMSPRPNRFGPLHLSMSQIVKATNNFSEGHQIGRGGFGIVYKGFLDDGQIIAIKRAKKEHFENLRTEFKSEVDLLSKIDHRNLVKLLGYMEKGNERLIITEYVGNGTLRDHLDGARGKILDFNQRLEIAMDVCHGLTYLHLFAEKQIIHRDVNSSNILLTESMKAKVADFGFARGGPSDPNQTHIVTQVKGTVGYLDPEYARTYKLTTKSDVYSFGILLIEILTGRRPVETKRPMEERITVRWAFDKYEEGNVRELVDPNMREQVSKTILRKMFGLAFDCAAPTRKDRPDMKEVGDQLWTIRSNCLKLSRG
ncbi:PREDICTED: calmodulin-binding receptor-like cytoplasmic kinase 3 [Tarenaya hassleriana]|uniref:calmodulin-binding receptor-like cytoplasmic kinase 3 n=1 Tax=Tarenaya hassleriana TaxID=28532 RepID=UPI00053C08EF|nr:PREDICTED: calmodulin-binding receptor-like cytoplasmic kinase 3 [Tarenaya hassleriana]XP_010557614.1 PREDICTED: calmodulin-binding receptor-like cytoplasmic kinase 3 [Tarenaya hassleriana]